MTTAAILSVENATVRFGVRAAVSDVSLVLQRKEMCALIGPNGAGKSTLLNAVSGHVPLHHGRMRLNGSLIDDLPPQQRVRVGLSRTFQIAAGFRSLTAAECVTVPLVSRTDRGSWESVSSLFEAAVGELKRVGLADQASVPINEMSYGDLKKLDLAIALAANPVVLLLDEPTAGVGVSERHDLLRVVQRLNEQGSLTVLFSEHDMDVVFAFASRVLVLHEGKLIADGTPTQIRENNLVKDVYLGATT